MPKLDDKISYQSGYKYQLYASYTHELQIVPPDGTVKLPFITWHEDGYLIIQSGYAWDGPSGPTWDTDTFMRGSLVHDALYQLMRLGCMDKAHRCYADELLRDICIEDGMWSFRAWYVYKAVRSCGESAATNSREVKVAP